MKVGAEVANRRGTAAGQDEQRAARRNIRHLRALWPIARAYKKWIAGAFVALVVAAGATLAIGQAVRRMVDFGFGGSEVGFLDQYFIALFGVFVVLAGATFARFYLVSWLGERIIADIRKAVFQNVIGLSPAFFETTRTGEVLSRLTADTTLIQTVVGSSLSMALRNVLLFLGGSVMLFVTSPKLGGFVLLVVPVVVGPIVIFGRLVRRLSRASQDRIAEISARAEESLNAVQTVQAFTHEALDRRAFAAATEGAFSVAVRRIRARAILTAVVILLVFGAVDLVLWIGATDVATDQMTGGELAAFVFYAVIVAGALGALSEVWGDLQRAAGATERLIELTEVTPEIRAPAAPKSLPAAGPGAVAFADISFEYPTRPGVQALEHFSLDIQPGETVALVGPSGAGKSTVFQLLLRFFDPTAGRILFDGVAIDELDPKDLRAVLGLVAQEPVLFSASALENIRYGRPDASDDEVRAAAEAADAAGFLAALPDGFQTEMGDRGQRLSGGQRQRIAIARAILRNPRILLLDEATSALDAESERAVQIALNRLMADRTTVVIAHRLATVLKADRIVVMDAGRIVASGRHHELMAQGGLYARLAELQFDTGAEALSAAQ